MMGAIENSVKSFKARGIEVILVSNMAEFEAASERVQQRLAGNPDLKVVLNAHGMPGSAHFGDGFQLDDSNAHHVGQKLKGVSEIFMFSCSFGRAEEATRRLAEGAQTHVMSSDRTMYAAIGRGDSPGVQGDSSFVHAYPLIGKNGKTFNEADITNPNFKQVGRLLFDPPEPGRGEDGRNRIIRPEEQRLLPPSELPPQRENRRDPNGGRNGLAQNGNAYRSPASIGSGSGGSSGGGSGGGGSSGAGGGSSSSSSGGGAMAYSFAAPLMVIPTAPKDIMLNFDNDGTPREPKRDPEFASPLVFAPLLPALRKLGEKAPAETANTASDH